MSDDEMRAAFRQLEEAELELVHAEHDLRQVVRRVIMANAALKQALLDSDPKEGGGLSGKQPKKKPT